MARSRVFYAPRGVDNLTLRDEQGIRTDSTCPPTLPYRTIQSQKRGTSLESKLEFSQAFAEERIQSGASRSHADFEFI